MLLTPSGIEPVTFRIVTQCINQSFTELSEGRQINCQNTRTNVMVFCDVNITIVPAIREQRVSVFSALMTTIFSVLSDNLSYTLSSYRIQNSALLDLLTIICPQPLWEPKDVKCVCVVWIALIQQFALNTGPSPPVRAASCSGNSCQRLGRKKFHFYQQANCN